MKGHKAKPSKLNTESPYGLHDSQCARKELQKHLRSLLTVRYLSNQTEDSKKALVNIFRKMGFFFFYAYI